MEQAIDAYGFQSEDSATKALEIRLPRLPCDVREVIDVAEVLVAGDQGERVLPCDGRDPKIIFGYRASLYTKQVLDLAIMPGGLRIATQYCVDGCELPDPAHIFLRARRFFGAIVQFLSLCSV